MKNKKEIGNFCQIFNEAIEKLNQRNPKIPYSTRWLYIHLNLLEHRFTGGKEDFYTRSLNQLHSDTGISRRLIIEGIKTLTELGLIETWLSHWIYKNTSKKSTQRFHAFRIIPL